MMKSKALFRLSYVKGFRFRARNGNRWWRANAVEGTSPIGIGGIVYSGGQYRLAYEALT
jgi:hypothetical protein